MEQELFTFPSTRVYSQVFSLVRVTQFCVVFCGPLFCLFVLYLLSMVLSVPLWYIEKKNSLSIKQYFSQSPHFIPILSLYKINNFILFKPISFETDIKFDRHLIFHEPAISLALIFKY